MSDLSQSSTVTRPRPMPGRICVAPIPASLDSKKATGGFLAIVGIEVEMGFMAGIVQEVGEVPEELERHVEYLYPFEVGATVYYQEASAIKLKGWHIVPLSSIVAWEAQNAA